MTDSLGKKATQKEILMGQLLDLSPWSGERSEVNCPECSVKTQVGISFLQLGRSSVRCVQKSIRLEGNSVTT